MFEKIKKGIFLLYLYFSKVALLFFGLSLIYLLYKLIQVNIIISLVVGVSLFSIGFLTYKYRLKLLNNLYDYLTYIRVYIFNLQYIIIYKLDIEGYSKYIIPVKGIYVYSFDDTVEYAEKLETTGDIKKFLEKVKGVINEEDLDKMYAVKTDSNKSFIYLFNVEKKVGKNRYLVKYLISIVEEILELESNKAYNLNNKEDYEKNYEKNYEIRENSDSYSIVIKWE